MGKEINKLIKCAEAILANQSQWNAIELRKSIDIVKSFKKKKSITLHSFTLPSDIKMDKQILKIMDKNLQAGTVADNTEGIICNRFATSLKIVQYIKKLTNNK